MALYEAAYPTPGFNGLGMKTDERDFLAVGNLLSYLPEYATTNKPLLAVEIGVWTGGMTTLFAKHFSKVICIDHWRGSPGDHSREMLQKIGGSQLVFDTFCRNMAPYLYRNVFPVMGDSRQIAATWPADLKADLIYIDAGHDYADVAADIAAWAPHVREGGILAGHDYNPDFFPGVVQAVNEIEPDHLASPERAQVWWKFMGSCPGRKRSERQARRPGARRRTRRRAFSKSGGTDA